MESIAPKYRHVAFWVLSGATLVACMAMLLPFLPAILWATVLAVLMYPIYRRLNNRFSKGRLEKMGQAKNAASFLTVISTVLIILLPLSLIGVGLFAQLGGVSNSLAGETGRPSFESALESVDRAIQPFVDKVGGEFSVKQYVDEHREEIAQSLRAPIAKLAGHAGFTILTSIVALLTMFFMLRDGEAWRKPALELIPLPPAKTRDILERTGETIRAVFVGTVLVALVQGAIMGIAYLIAGVPNSLLLGVATAVLAVIPLLGPPAVYIPVGAMLLLQGNTTGGLVVLGAGFLIASQIDNLLKPFLIGGRTNLHPLGIFFSILGGVLLVGPIGVMAGPMLLTIFLGIVEVVRTSVHHQSESEKAAT